MFEDDNLQPAPRAPEGEVPVPVSVVQRKAIVTYLRSGLSRNEIAAKVGVTPLQVSAVTAHVTRGTYGDASDAVDASEVEDEGPGPSDTTVRLERDLQLALRRSISQLEPTLTVVDGNREQTTASGGRIDITARDPDGTIVVIELKAGTADLGAISQILSYMGDLMDGATRVRGIVVAGDFAPRAIAAARAAPNIRLVRYGFRFSFDPVGTSAPIT